MFSIVFGWTLKELKDVKGGLVGKVFGVRVEAKKGEIVRNLS